MDPLTAALQLANTIAEIVKLTIEAQPPEVRAAYAKAQLEDFQKWRDFLSRLAPKGTP
jgi:hypothetical protein